MKQIVSLASVFICLLMQTGFAQKPAANQLPPGTIPATADGYSMRAKINGKECKASFMMPAMKTEQIVGFYEGDKYIGLPFTKSDMVPGKKVSFNNQNADLTTNDAVGVWSGRNGEMQITKVKGKWMEGIFFFTGYSYDNKKTISVTDGFFRVALDK